MPVTHLFVNPQPDGADTTVTRPSDWNAAHVISVVDADVDPAAAIAESKLALNFATHAAVTLGTANGLSLVGQALSLGLASSGVTGALSGTDWDTFNGKQAALTFPLASTLGGTGVNNAGTLTNASNTTITGGGTLALGGFTLTVPATGTAALLATANVFSATQKIYVSGAFESVALSFYNATVGSLPAYGIGMGNTDAEGVVSYRSGTGSTDVFGHRFLVNNDQKLFIGGATTRITSTLVGIGAGVPTHQLDIITSGTPGASTRGLNVSQHNDGVQSAMMSFTKSRGTKTAPTTVQNGDIIGAFVFRGYSGSAYLTDNALFGASITGTVTTSSVPTSIYFIAGAIAGNYTPDLLIYSNHFIGIGPIGGTIISSLTAPAARLHLVDTATDTGAIREVQRIEAIVSTAFTGGAAGFGVGQSFYAETATNGTNQQQGLISTSWIDATNATRKAKMSLSAYDTAARLGLEIEADGSAVKLGFYGVATVARATTGIAEAAFTENAGGAAVNVDSTFGGYTLQQIAQALQNIGILT